MQANVADSPSYLQAQLSLHSDKISRRVKVCGKSPGVELVVIQLSKDRCQLKSPCFSGQVDSTITMYFSAIVLYVIPFSVTSQNFDNDSKSTLLPNMSHKVDRISLTSPCPRLAPASYVTQLVHSLCDLSAITPCPVRSESLNMAVSRLLPVMEPSQLSSLQSKFAV